jgi:hypothetical protein
MGSNSKRNNPLANVHMAWFSLEYLDFQNTEVFPILLPGVFSVKCRVPKNRSNHHLQRHRQSKSRHADQDLIKIEAMVWTTFEKYRGGDM